MRILYGVQGTGNGHVSRSTRIIDCLQKRGITVDVIFSGCDTDKVYDQSVIGEPAFFKGFTFSVRDGRIHYLDTIQQLSIRQFVKDVQSFDASAYDLVITDFEPVSSRIAGKNKLPCIGIGHQYAFLHDIPMDRSSLLSRWIIQHFAVADHSIGMHWHHFGQPIVPPVIPGGVTSSDTMDPALVLVYLPFENRDQVRQMLQPFRHMRFAVYAQNQGVPIKEDNHILWHPFSKTSFFKDLSTCSGVICNAGFELPSEALSLGKKILVKPLKGQFEQVSNAMAMEHLDLGTVMTSLDRHCVETWLLKPSKGKKDYPDVADHISQWVLDGNWSDTSKLVKETWS
ncbi:MAG: MJ1255/VC2487 family glycosyltransferase [Pseudomonadota bacterium]